MTKKLNRLSINNIYHSEAKKFLRHLPDNSIDSIVCDPPYELGFMGKKWDNSGIAYDIELWREALRVLKPGGHLLAFSGTRTYHRMAVAIEDAGFEIRDQISYLYFSGFPKSHNIAKAITANEKTGKSNPKAMRKIRMGEDYEPTGQVDYQKGRMFSSEIKSDDKETELTPLAQKWNGWGTALKPAHEPIVLARKPISEKNIAENVLKWGTGAVNVDATRISTDDNLKEQKAKGSNGSDDIYGKYDTDAIYTPNENGRFPANCITLDDDQFYSKYFNITPPEVSKKASKKDRNSNFQGNPITGEKKHASHDGRNKHIENPYQRHDNVQVNNHPTVKPIDLMAWLVKLVTPINGIVCDPFSGSGSTLVAAKREGYNFIGCDMTNDYVKIARARLSEQPAPDKKGVKKNDKKI